MHDKARFTEMNLSSVFHCSSIKNMTEAIMLRLVLLQQINGTTILAIHLSHKICVLGLGDSEI